MAAVYKQFLAAPSSSLLADDAWLHYVTTTTSFSGAGAILKHLVALHGQVNKKSEQVVYCVEGGASIAVEIDTALHFQTSGGVYLPGIDDNFLANEKAQLLIMHIVNFNEEGKISQIRQQWDQGSLLKQMDLIGKSGRNWPIRDSKDQLALVQSCLKASSSGQAANGQAEALNKCRPGVPNAMRDPHASLHLFATREEREAMQFAPVPSPYAGQRPKQRAPTDFLTDMPQCGEADPYRASPSKAGLKEVQPIRVFGGHDDDDVDSDEDEKPKAKLPHITAHPTKFEHFAFHDGPNPNPGAAAPAWTPKGMQSPYSQSTSKLSFEDYNSAPIKAVPMKGMRNLGSVEDPVALGNITNGRANGVKDAEPNFALSDKSPSNSNSNSKDLATQTLIDAVRTMDINDAAVPRKNLAENERHYGQEPRIHVAGDGMGGRRGAARDFLFGGNDDVQPHRPIMARKTGPSSSQSSLWDM